MTEREIQSAEDFNLEEVILSSDRLDIEYNITNITMEVNIYEDINKPYLTGSLAVLDDDKDLFGTADIQGTERISITVSAPVPGAPKITKNFVITNVNKISKQNDYSSVIIFSIIEDIGYLNSIKQFSKMYDGKGESIIAKVLRDQLNKELFRGAYETYQSSHQPLGRILVPFTNPFTVTDLMLDKISTGYGFPYYLYSTFNTDELFLADYETIIDRDPFNVNEPFVYSQSAANKTQDIGEQARTILTYEASNIEDTLFLSQIGAVGARYSVTNVTDGSTTEFRLDMNRILARLKNTGIVDPSDRLLFDNEFIPDPSGRNQKKLSDYDSRFFDEIAGSTYPYEEQVLNWTEEASPDNYKLRAIKFAIKQHILKNVYNITVPGLLFLTDDPQTTVGNQIEVNIFKNSILTDNSLPENIIDEKKSGNYIMIAKRHIFNAVDMKHTCSIQCARFTNPGQVL